MARRLAPVMYWTVHTNLCSALLSDAGAVAIPGGDATSALNALNGSAVEPFEDLGTHAKSFQSQEWENVLSCPLHDCLGVFEPW